MDERTLKIELYERLVDTYTLSKEFGYKPTQFLQMLNEGGIDEVVNTAKTLILAKPTADGFTRLWKENKLELSVEAVVLEGRWKTLFEEKVLKEARDKLKQLKFDFKEYNSSE